MGAICSSASSVHAAEGNSAPSSKVDEASSQKETSAALERKKIAEQVVRKVRENREHRNVVVGENFEDVEALGKDVKITKYEKDQKDTDIIMKALRSHFLFGSLRPKEMLQVASAMKPECCDEGTAVITQGEQGEKANKFYVIKSGTFDIIVDGKKVNSEGSGSSFGELALMYNAPRAATVMASEDAEYFTLDRLLFKLLLIEVTNKQAKARYNFLKEVPLLKGLGDAEIDHLAEALTVMQFEDKTNIIKQGDEGDTFYIIEEGVVTIHKDNNPDPISELSVGGYFGEQALLKKEVRGATVRAKGLVRCLVLSKDDFEKIFGKMEDLMKRVHDQRLKAEADKKASKIEEYEMENIKASELVVCGVIGQGAFGLVKLVKTKGSNPKPLALKQLQKKRLVMTKQMSNVVREKQIMRKLLHPHILKLTGTFSDRNSLYFVLEYLQGGDVFSRLCKQGGRFDMRTTRTYAACVTDSFDYMHAKHIIYRDLKPENLVLDKDGVIKVVDFGMAKHTVQRTFTVCGTPEYMAPEIINGRGHHKAVDYWALGVLIHEMFLGSTPFGGNNTSHLEIYKAVNSMKEIEFPKGTDRDLQAIVRQLLKKRPTRRLGCLKAGCAGIKAMSWFKKTDWSKIRAGTTAMPLKPQCKDAFDMSNFDDWGDNHKVLEYKTSKLKFEKNWEKHFPYCGIKKFE